MAPYFYLTTAHCALFVHHSPRHNVINRNKMAHFDLPLPTEMDPARLRELPGRGINPPLIKIGLNTVVARAATYTCTIT